VIAIGVPRTSPHRATALPTEEAYHVLARRSWLPQDRDVRADPIERITPNGLETRAREYALDMIIFATGSMP